MRIHIIIYKYRYMCINRYMYTCIYINTNIYNDMYMYI